MDLLVLLDLPVLRDAKVNLELLDLLVPRARPELLAPREQRAILELKVLPVLPVLLGH